MRGVVVSRVFLLVGVWVALMGHGLGAKPVGLPTVSNTCWMNSLLQNLMNMEPFVAGLLKSGKKEAPDVKSLVELIEACRQARAENKGAVGEAYTRAVRDMFLNETDLYQPDKNPWQQHDPSDGLLAWINFSDKAGATFTNLFVSKTGFTEVSQITEQGYEPRVQLTPKSTIITVRPVEQDYTLESLLHKTAFEKEILDKNKTKQLFLGVGLDGKTGLLPEFLIITIARAFRGGREASAISAPDEFDMSPFLFASVEKQPTVYNLIGVVVQTGGLNAGHYRTYIQDHYDPDRLWYQCDDDDIIPVTTKKDERLKSVTDVSKGYGGVAPFSDVRKNCYLLFYRKKSLDEASSRAQRERRSEEELRRTVKEKLVQEKLEQTKFVQEKLEQEKLEQTKLEQEKPEFSKKPAHEQPGDLQELLGNVSKSLYELSQQVEKPVLPDVQAPKK